MHISHPLRRGFFLSCAMMAMILATGACDALSAFGQTGIIPGQSGSPDSFSLFWVLMIIPGSLLAALPSRLRRHSQNHDRILPQRCLTSLIGGILLGLGTNLAGGNIIAGLFQGNISAWSFLLIAWTVSFFLLRLQRRRP